MAGPGEGEYADWFRELGAGGPQSNSCKSRDGTWADDSEVAEFLVELHSATGNSPLSAALLAVLQIDGQALPRAFASASTAAVAVSPLGFAAGPRKRKTDTVGLRQDARDCAAPAPAPRISLSRCAANRPRPGPGGAAVIGSAPLL